MTDEQLREWLKGRGYKAESKSSFGSDMAMRSKCGSIRVRICYDCYEVSVKLAAPQIYHWAGIDYETPAQAKEKILKLEEVQKLLGEVFE